MTKNYDVWKLRLDLGKRADRIGIEQTLETWQAMVLKVGHTEAEKWFTKAVEHKMVLQHATPNLWPFGMKWFALLVFTIIALHRCCTWSIGTWSCSHLCSASESVLVAPLAPAEIRPTDLIDDLDKQKQSNLQRHNGDRMRSTDHNNRR